MAGNATHRRSLQAHADAAPTTRQPPHNRWHAWADQVAVPPLGRGHLALVTIAPANPNAKNSLSDSTERQVMPTYGDHISQARSPDDGRNNTPAA